MQDDPLFAQLARQLIYGGGGFIRKTHHDNRRFRR
jgi:hypothetical protein